ncbi:MAG TPA: o-succinylbenzoate synthase [Actinomycetaceae bacterium]|nr:o-succinylbenzoate synthase [Actinomycetaceae bacterium]
MPALAYSTELTSRFRGLTRRDGLLLRGPAGWSEFSPFHEYDDWACVPWLRAAIDAATSGYPAPLRDRVRVNVTVPAVGPERAHEIVSSSGCATAKVKVAEPSQTLAEAEERLEAVRDALGPSGAIRIDANGAWFVGEALAAIPRLDRAAGGLQYVEQPCETVEELAAVRRAVGVPIAADESIRRAADPMRVVRLAAADVIVLKVQPLGGVRACLDLAERAGLPVVVSSALESSVGIAAGVALAAALPAAGVALAAGPLASGLATVQLFGTDVADRPLLPERGAVAVRAVEPALDNSTWLADDATTSWWIERARRVGELLTPEERQALAELLAP